MSTVGRIDIEFPDGRRETLWLDEGALTIGGGRDNSFQAPHAGLGRRQLRFFRDGDGAYLTNLDASQAVTIDGAPAQADIPQRLPAVSQIRAGDLRIVFNLSSDQPTEAMAAFSDATQPTAAGFRAQVESAEIQAWAYSSATAALRIENLDAEIGHFHLETGGAAAAWTSPERLTVVVDGHDSLETLLQIRPPVRSDFAPGAYPLTIAIRRLDGLEEAVHLSLIVRLGAFGGLRASLDPPMLRPKSPFALRLRNHGNQALPLRLRAHEPERWLSIRLERRELQLGAGEHAVATGLAEARRKPVFGKSREIDFALQIQAGPPYDYRLTLPATVVIDPWLPTRLLIALALVFGLAMLAFAALLHQPPKPQIARLQLSQRQVAQGTPVELRWEAVDARRFVIEVGPDKVAELPGEASSYTLDTGAYVDPVDITLSALNGEASDILSAALEVFQPATIDHFTADKAALTRDLPGELTISWRATGAAALDISLPPGFEKIREFSVGEAGEIVIRGKPAEDIRITLRAWDETGAITRRALDIAVEPAECAPTDDILLYQGPDSGFDRASYARREAPVLAKGRSADEQWLQVELANGATGWGARERFACRGFDPASLVVVDSPARPQANPTPGASPASDRP